MVYLARAKCVVYANQKEASQETGEAENKSGDPTEEQTGLEYRLARLNAW